MSGKPSETEPLSASPLEPQYRSVCISGHTALILNNDALYFVE